MEIKALIVDDEKYERVLLSKLINWEELGISLVGEAASAMEALEKYTELKPDIILTDISMPQMDGLELCRKLKKCNPQIRLVIVTGFGEFDYAKQAIKIGVEDFLLKPIDPDEVKTLLGRLKEEICKERIKEQVLSDSLPVLAEDYTRKLLLGEENPEVCFQKAQGYLQKSEKWNDFQVCNIKISGEAIGKEIYQSCIQVIEQLIPRFLICQFSDNEIAVLCPAQTRQCYEVCEKQLRALVKDRSILLAVSDVFSDIGCAARAFRECKTIMVGSLWNLENVIFYDKYIEMEKKAEQLYPRDFDQYVLAVKNGQLEDSIAFIDRYLEQYIRNGMVSAVQLRNMGVILLHNLEKGLNQWGRGIGDIIGEDIYHQVAEIQNLKEFCLLFNDLLEKSAEYVKTLKSSNTNQTVNICKEYILEHMNTPGLSLKNIADSLFVNESYLSRIFKQSTGESVNRYLMRCRIEKSMELLSTTTLKAYEVGEMVGLPDAHYFGLAFKKYVGKTVNEFRSQNREG